MDDILDRVNEAITDMHIYAFHHGAAWPIPKCVGRGQIIPKHTPSSQGKDHKLAREEWERTEAELQASVARLRDVVGAAGALWYRYFEGVHPDDMTPEMADFIASLGRLQQQDVGDTARIEPIGAKQ